MHLAAERTNNEIPRAVYHAEEIELHARGTKSQAQAAPTGERTGSIILLASCFYTDDQAPIDVPLEKGAALGI